MRILYICGDQGIPAFGRKGASTHLREMIAAFRAIGHDVLLAASDISGDRRPEEDFDARRLPAPRSRMLGIDGRYLLANWSARSVLAGLAAEFRPDAIYERHALYFTAGQWLARRTGLPRILEVNSLLSHEQHERLHFPALARRMELGTIRSAPAVAAISGYMAKRLQELGCRAESLRPFPMAVDPARFHPVADPAAKRRELGWPDTDIVLGYIGSMNTYHQPNWFTDLAEKLLRRDEARLRFLIVGGSDSKVQRHRGRLLKWVKEGRVHYQGSVPQAELAQWMAAMDAVLVPGAAPQSTPTKIFEAAAVGRPLILPATEPIRELCGADAPYLFKPNDFASFESRVREFIAAPAIFREPADCLHRKVQAEHTWEHHARSLTAWFKELA